MTSNFGNRPVAVRALVGPLSVVALGSTTFMVTLSCAVSGELGGGAASVLAPAGLLAAVIASWTLLRRAGVVDAERPLLRCHGLWLLTLLVALELPLLGAFGLIDPWETHYAEVAREMLARGDFISPWWAHQSWFMSKPVLTFWLEALSMKALGMQTAAGKVLGEASGGFAHPEWAVRLPGALFSLAGCCLLYRGVAANADRGAGLAATVVLATTAHWTLAARHALTDTPFVAALTGCFGFMMLAANTPDDELLVRHRVSFGRASLTIDGRMLSVGCIVCAVGAQLLVLLSLHVDLDLSTAPPRLAIVADTLNAGSPGNCGLPSQPACAVVPLAHPDLSPALQAAAWCALLAVFVYSVARERRVRRQLLLMGWFCVGLATLGKGAAGFVLPLAVAAASWLERPIWRDLRRAELVRGGVLCALLVAPWFVATFARHGRVFFDELVLRHMFGRALDHLHDTNAGEDVSFRYYIWQLGYATFPWTGLIPGALISACAERGDRPPALSRVQNLALLWLLLAFAMFSVMRTKYHHYILPAVPALAVLVGVYLAERWAAAGTCRHRTAVARVLDVGGALLMARVGADLILPVDHDIPGAARLFHLVSYQYHRPWPVELDFQGPLLATIGTSTAISLGLASGRWRRPLIVAQLGVSIALSLWLGQRYLPRLGPSFGQREVIEAFQRDRASAAEPLVAYRLNWKGENFYTGNHTAIFVSSGKALQRYLRRRRQSEPVLHVVLETSRLAALRAELGAVLSFDVLTDRLESDKICLVRVHLASTPTAER